MKLMFKRKAKNKEEALMICEDYIKRVYERIFKKSPVIRIKDGNLKYDMWDLWCDGKKEFWSTLSMIVKMCSRFPEVGYEITHDVRDGLDPNASPVEAYCRGYFECLHDLNKFRGNQ